MNKLLRYVDISKEVVNAINENIPIVALETTISTHGMPYPKNLETALMCENIVRGSGAVPATLGVINGRIKIGLSQEEIKFLCESNTVIKMSRRDLPIVVSKKLNGATTVATSILIANMAGIKVLATGGIGGAHINAQKSFDISRDLQEIATNDICVVCSGAKALFDVGLTLEYLETFGVPVIGFQTDQMPEFYMRDSGYKLDYRMETEEEIGQTIKTKWDLGLDGGVIVANPISEEYALNHEDLDQIILATIQDAESKGIHGKKLTPYILEALSKATEGRTLMANIELLRENTRLASLIAREVYKEY